VSFWLRYFAESSSFLKKRTKKLLLRFARSFQGHWPKIIKVFLLLFVHKKKFFFFLAF